MRGRTKVISLATLLLIIFTSSMVFASGVVDPSRISLLGYTPPIEPNADGAQVLVDPATIIKDYINNPGYQVGNPLDVSVKVSGVTNLYAYQVNVTWTPGVLNYTGVTYGSVLYSRNAFGSSSHNPDGNQIIAKASNQTGCALIAESVLKDATNPSADGTLFTIHFKIARYGYTKITIVVAGTFATQLLNDAGSAVSFTPVNGYFRNALTGDANIDKTIDVYDILAVKSRWGRTPASGDWIREYDVNDDAIIDVYDILTVKANWGRTVP